MKWEDGDEGEEGLSPEYSLLQVIRYFHNRNDEVEEGRTVT